MKIQEHMPAFPFERMPWFTRVHGEKDTYQCMEGLRNNWYEYSAVVQQWFRQSCGEHFGQRYLILPTERGIHLRANLQPSPGVPHRLRNYVVEPLRVCAIINNLKEELRCVFADMLCVEAIQNMSEARSIIMEPVLKKEDISPLLRYENGDAIGAFMGCLNGQTYGEMCDQITEWEKDLRMMYSMITKGNVRL